MGDAAMPVREPTADEAALIRKRAAALVLTIGDLEAPFALAVLTLSIVSTCHAAYPSKSSDELAKLNDQTFRVMAGILPAPWDTVQ
jgi:hypothetical protein